MGNIAYLATINRLAHYVMLHILNNYIDYSYDAEERAVGTVSDTASDKMKLSVKTSYSRQGQPLSVATTVTTPDSVYTLSEQLTPYASGEPWTHRARLTVSDGAGMSATTPASGHEYMYNNLGQLAGHNANNIYVNTGYTYDMRGRLKQLYTNQLSQTLEYEGSDVPCYNGNISGMTLSLRNTPAVTRRYRYDGLNRLSMVAHGDTLGDVYVYSLNSSPLIILRGNSMVTLSYDGNRPVGVGSRKFGYDVDGRLTSDATRGISDILYSPNDRPVCVSTDEGTRLECRYDATGRKLTEQTVKWEPLMRSWQIVKSAMRVYVGPFEFSTLGDGISLERVNLPWGYLDANRREMRYIKDYQGNVLAVTDASGMLHQATDYTPYGQPSALSTLAANYGIDIPAADNRRLYGGKEYETLRGLNFHDFEARMLFNDRGLFNRPDPKAIDYPGFNPYVYCAGNPLRYVDPSGEEVSYTEAYLMASYAYNVTDQNPNDDNLKQLIELGWSISSLGDDLPLVDEETGLKSVVFERTVDGKTEYAYAYAGTEKTDKKDLECDYALSNGLLHPQSSQAMSNAEKLETRASHNKSELTFVGHSLGGFHATNASRITSCKAITFNPAGTHIAIDSAIGNTSPINVTNYIIIGKTPLHTDPVFTAGVLHGVLPRGKIVPVNVGNVLFPHGLKNFEGLKF